MRWRLNSREFEDVAIIDAMEAERSPGESISDLRNAIKGLLEKGTKKILVNLADVDFIDSTGIGELIACYNSANRQSAKLKLLKPQSKVYKLLLITKLVTVFEIFYDEQEAIKSFRD